MIGTPCYDGNKEDMDRFGSIYINFEKILNDQSKVIMDLRRLISDEEVVKERTKCFSRIFMKTLNFGGVRYLDSYR